ncbi:MAG: hypothetical protein QOI80_497 [Solirubrobacteraceae bacterium]|nr:hypothetical protein [Solirubrobacteraceae bacterium]
MSETEACFSCGALVAPSDGPAHPYMRSSPGCWAAFGELQAAEMARFGYPEIHGMLVDCYAASHGGGGAERRDRQSVFIHLMAICARVERGMDGPARIALLQRLTAQKRDWPVIWPPARMPAVDHTHLRGTSDAAEYERRAWEWAGAVWEAYGPVQDEIRCALDQAFET